MIEKIITILAIFGLFFGIIQTLSYDILLTISEPKKGIQKLGYDIAQTLINSQEVVYQNTNLLLKAKDDQTKQFAISKIVAGSLVTLFFIWIFYKIIRFFVEAPKPTDKIMIILISLLLVYFLTIIPSYFLNLKISSYVPYYGWIYFLQNIQQIIYKLKLI
ncbi:MAG: hypothetical protein ACP5G1_03725 [Nanopusillaceae archaeon]